MCTQITYSLLAQQTVYINVQTRKLSSQYELRVDKLSCIRQRIIISDSTAPSAGYSDDEQVS